jgi:hypothetical protein
VEVTPGAGTRYVSILARVIRDFQTRYDVAGCTIDSRANALDVEGLRKTGIAEQ